MCITNIRHMPQDNRSSCKLEDCDDENSMYFVICCGYLNIIINKVK